MKKAHLLIIVALFVFYAINNYFWILQNKLPISYDEGVHLWTSLRFVRAFIYPAHNILYELFHADTTHWPPLFYLIASLFNLIFGTSYTVSVMTNMLFFLLLIISLYFIGKKLHNPAVGILAVVIVSFYPIIYGHSRLFQLDFALTAIVTFSIYCLISTDRFRDLRWSIIFGISAGLGMLIKWSYVIFIFPVSVFMLIEYLRGIKKKNLAYKLKNPLVAIAIASIISSMWYLIKLNNSMDAYAHLLRSISGYSPRLSDNASWLLLSFNNIILSFPFLLLLLFCLLTFYTRANSGIKLFTTIWYLAPILLLVLIRWKQPRFFLPVLPCLAFISAAEVNSIENHKLKKIIFGSIFAIGLIQYFYISFNPRIFAGVDKFNAKISDMDVIYKISKDSYSKSDVRPPYRKDWRHKDIIGSFAKHIQKLKDYTFLIGIIINGQDNERRLRHIFGKRMMNHYVAREFISSDIKLGAEIVLDPGSAPWGFIENISDMQGFIYVSNENKWPIIEDLGSLPVYRKADDPRLINLINSKEKFSLINTIKLPENYYAYIYIYNIPEVRHEDLLIKMFNGKIKIFYRQKEITKDIGLTSEFVYKNKVYKYKDAVWSYDRISPYQVRMVAEWPGARIVQSALISIDADRRDILNIKVNLESKENITLDSWYINNLISDEYKEWVRPFSGGVFKKISMWSDPDMFEPLDLEYSGPNVVGIRENPSKGLPAILFQSQDTDILMRTGVSNTNYYHNSRCVYITADSKIHLEAGKSKNLLYLNITVLSDVELKNAITGIEKEAF